VDECEPLVLVLVIHPAWPWESRPDLMAPSSRYEYGSLVSQN